MPLRRACCNLIFQKWKIGFRAGQDAAAQLQVPTNVMSSSPMLPPEEASMPRRHHSHLTSLSKDHTEKDLWLFDELDSVADTSATVEPTSPRGLNSKQRQLAESSCPNPNDMQAEHSDLDQVLPPVRDVDRGRNVKFNASVKPIKPIPQGGSPLKSKPFSDFGDLEQWDEPDVAPVTRITTEKIADAVASELVRISAEDSPPPAGPESTAVVPEPTAPKELPPEALKAAVSPAPGPSRFFLKLSKLERIGMATLAALLLISATLIYAYSVSRLHGSAVGAGLNDLPIKGSYLSITGVDSFWRAPITDGPGKDTFRRGTQLIPVVEVTLSGGQGALRVFFRDGDGVVIGDVVTRPVEAAQKIQVAATVGFDEIGMHAAYRTGQTKSWTVDIYEAPSVNSEASVFKKLLRLDVSTAQR
jgi:hypothetical protein